MAATVPQGLCHSIMYRLNRLEIAEAIEPESYLRILTGCGVA